MRVELRTEAQQDLIDGALFYELQRDGLGEYFTASLVSDLASLGSTGGIHEIAFGFHRKLWVRFHFAIYYRVVDESVNVVAILDCRQDSHTIARRLEGTE